MKMKKIALSIVALSMLSIPSLLSAEEENDDFSWLDRYTWAVETGGEVMTKIGVFTDTGSTHNPKRDSQNIAQKHDGGELYRSEITAKLFLNQEIGDETSWHAGLQINKDGNQIDGYDFTRKNSQFDWLRELYVDTAAGNMSWRIGKQQVVWGKADGVKFLDIINPTDFRHWGQDAMSDSRIPLWMITGEYAIGDTDSLQVVYVPQVEVTNQIPGLYNTKTGDQGQEFVPLGMETMFGQKNGFLNIGPELGMVSGAFTQGFGQLLPSMVASTNAAYGTSYTNANILQLFNGMTVSQFTGFDGSNPAAGKPDVSQFLGSTIANGSGYIPGSFPSGVTGNMMLSGIVNNSQTNPQATGGPGIGAKTNLMGVSLNTSSPTTMFDYMGDATFATFDAFVGLKTKHVKAHADNTVAEGNLGFKYAGTTSIGLNYTLNYFYHYDNNPVIDVSWEGTNGGTLTANRTVGEFAANGAPAAPGTGAYKTSTMNLLNADGTAYNYSVNGPATMVFTESQHRINTFGTSFDYAIDNSYAPVILRSEIVYDKDTLQPVVDLGKLAYGDFDGAFTNQKASFLNYVVGLDVTVLTNLFVSFQFMDKWNLDYKDENVQYDGNSKSYGKFTANPATMSLSNGFRKAQEHQIMYTFFLSKPFMESDALRANNIFLLENKNGGYWDRFDVEYSYSDDIILSAAINQYGGNKNGVFGQFEKMSNAQIGFKYIF